MKEEIVLYDLPKLSLNAFYSTNMHWTKRKKLKDTYCKLIPNKIQLEKNETVETEYHFEFKSRPLDASNTIAMVKLIEDILFADDSYKIVRSVKMTSRKGENDLVKIIITSKEI
jgi:hypothetical protein